jgi:hypothetical protein
MEKLIRSIANAHDANDICSWVARAVRLQHAWIASRRIRSSVSMTIPSAPGMRACRRALNCNGGLGDENRRRHVRVAPRRLLTLEACAAQIASQVLVVIVHARANMQLPA